MQSYFYVHVVHQLWSNDKKNPKINLFKALEPWLVFLIFKKRIDKGYETSFSSHKILVESFLKIKRSDKANALYASAY